MGGGAYGWRAPPTVLTLGDKITNWPHLREKAWDPPHWFPLEKKTWLCPWSWVFSYLFSSSFLFYIICHRTGHKYSFWKLKLFSIFFHNNSIFTHFFLDFSVLFSIFYFAISYYWLFGVSFCFKITLALPTLFFLSSKNLIFAHLHLPPQLIPCYYFYLKCASVNNLWVQVRTSICMWLYRLWMSRF